MDLFQTLQEVYPEAAKTIYSEIDALIRSNKTSREPLPLSQRDAVLITYGSTLHASHEPPLRSLDRFLKTHLEGIVSAVHILPMFPYSSDDGFSVKDYETIDPALGSWEDVRELAKSFDLMFDAIINHVSKSSVWFNEYRKGNPDFKDFFIEYDESWDYSKVVRPRSTPLFHKYVTYEGKKWLWSTFSEDQVDLNFQNPKVLLKILKVLIFYAKMGARYIRLDAVGFIWKESGTPCIHHENTHRLLRIIRHVLDKTVPGTILVSETNVPHEENVAYFGENYDEAHMVYQFPLPPLVFHAYLMQDNKALLQWTHSLRQTKLSDDATYFNFLASHDGIGMRPTEGLIDDYEREQMVSHVKRQGGYASYKSNSDGSESVYELNINYYDALYCEDDSEKAHIKKFLGAHGILLAFKGIPGIYIHSLIGSRSDFEGVASSNIPRRINRGRLSLSELEDALQEPGSRRHKIFYGFQKLMEIRCMKDAFDPKASQRVLDTDVRIFAFVREGETTTIGVFANLTKDVVSVQTGMQGLDLISNQPIDHTFALGPYQLVWLESNS